LFHDIRIVNDLLLNSIPRKKILSVRMKLLERTDFFLVKKK